mgnify:CR=1 FL=1
MTNIELGTQSNAILVDDLFLELFLKEQVYIGISLDGPPEYNDQHRYYHNKKGSGKDVVKALMLLKDFPYFSGILSVINIDYDPLFHIITLFPNEYIQICHYTIIVLLAV